jgi:hypothetical protein
MCGYPGANAEPDGDDAREPNPNICMVIQEKHHKGEVAIRTGWVLPVDGFCRSAVPVLLA